MPGGTRRRAYSHGDYRGRPKVGWVAPGPALAAARRLARVQGWPVDVYTCRTCERYHLGRGSDDLRVSAGVARLWPSGAQLGGLAPV